MRSRRAKPERGFLPASSGRGHLVCEPREPFLLCGKWDRIAFSQGSRLGSLAKWEQVGLEPGAGAGCSPLEGAPSPREGSRLSGNYVIWKDLKEPLFPYPLILQTHHNSFQNLLRIWELLLFVMSPQGCPHPAFPRDLGRVPSRRRGDLVRAPEEG